tara:strand:- start:1090 stop:1896 length:807 start_codon:yes stop_codon:yes gene_type:complete
MFQLKNKVVVITGASEGIGKSLALEFGKRGAITVITARSTKKLKKVESILKSNNADVFSITLDITSKSSIKYMIKKVMEKYGKLDILINNAGVGLFEKISNSKWSDTKKLFDTNFFGPLICMQLVLPHMRRRKEGLIVNISSAISKHSLFYQGIYSASKAALERITESLDIEEYRHGVKTLLIIPDRTKTNFNRNILGSKRLVQLPFKLPMSNPNIIAKKIVASIIEEKHICYTTLRSRVYSLAAGFYPEYINKTFKKSYNKLISKSK